MMSFAFAAVLAAVVVTALLLKNSVKVDIGAWGTHVRLEAEGKVKKRE